MNALAHAVQTALQDAKLWKEHAVLLVGVSGGSDSVALLHALCRLRSVKPLDLHVLHVQHGLRGEASAADEQFVRNLCGRLHVPLTVEYAHLQGDMTTPGMETLARDERRRLFAKHLSALNADALLTAHHRDDQTETVLMHLLRGSGLHGLRGMQTVSSFHGKPLLRPFLNVPKQQLLQALKALPYREDASNALPVTPRNALRMDLLPRAEALFPAAGAHIAQLAESVSADEDFLSQQANECYQSVRLTRPPLFALRLAPLQAAHESIRRRVLRQWFSDGLTAAGLTPDQRALCHADTLALSALCFQPEGSVLNLPCGLMAAREKHLLHLVRQTAQPLQDAPAPLPQSAGSCEWPHLTVSARKPEHLPQNADSVILTPELLSRHPVWRLPQAGDVIRPFGAPGHKLLRRYMTDRKTDRFLRSIWPVLCVQNEVLWIPGLCASEATRLDQTPPDGIQLIICGESPFKSPKE